MTTTTVLSHRSRHTFEIFANATEPTPAAREKGHQEVKGVAVNVTRSTSPHSAAAQNEVLHCNEGGTLPVVFLF